MKVNKGMSQDSTIAPSPGGTFYDNSLVYSMAAKVNRPLTPAEDTGNLRLYFENSTRVQGVSRDEHRVI